MMMNGYTGYLSVAEIRIREGLSLLRVTITHYREHLRFWIRGSGWVLIPETHSIKFDFSTKGHL